MKISRIELYLLKIPFRKPFCFFDTILDEMVTVLLRLTDSEGRSGWGEVFPGNTPVLTAAWSAGVFYTLRDCVLPMLGTDLSFDSSEILAERLQSIRGNRHVKGILDQAFWDLDAKRKGKPLHEAIGGTKKEIELGIVFDRYEELTPFLDDLNRAVSEGFSRVTLKIRPGWDLQILRYARNEQPSVTMQCDVEGALDLEQHGEILYRFDDFMISLLEQPLPASEYVGHAMLQDRMRTNIGLDESITTLHQAQIAFDLRSGNTFCIKPGKVGGLTSAKTIHDACVSADVACYAGCDCATSIGYRFTAALGSLPQFVLPTDYLRLDEILTADPGIPLETTLSENEKGELRRVLKLWDEPGIGFEPDLEMIEKHTIKKVTVY